MPTPASDVDTAPIPVGTPPDKIESVSASLGPEQRYVLTLAPPLPLSSPTLHMSTRPRCPTVLAESVLCGNAELAGQAPVDSYRPGLRTTSAFSRHSPLRVVLRNPGRQRIVVDVTLIESSAVPGGPGTYRLKHGE